VRHLISRTPALAALAALAASITLGCAQPGAPPGAPDEKEPPRLVAITPDSGAVNVEPREVRFEFDEVVSERPQGAVDLAGLVVISPREGAPRVGWHRKAISVRPRRGWRDSTAYTVTVLPGLADLRGNVTKEPVSVIFSTGPTIPAGRIAGIAFDWVGGRAAPFARVEATIPPDTTTAFVTVADSSGRFELAHLRGATYAVIGYADPNNNQGRDPREPYDSLGLTLRDSARVELYLFVHDTIAPRIAEVAVRDSVTLEVTLDRPMDPRQRVDSSLFLLKAADSTIVPIANVTTLSEFTRMQDSLTRLREDSLRRAQPGRAVPIPPRRPTAAERGDTVRLGRPQPIVAMVVRVRARLAAASPYRLILRGARGLLGVTDTTARVFSTPVPAAPADTTRGRP
jgi:hypothetical protein